LIDRGIRLIWTPAARRMLAGRGYDPTFGARPLKRLIQKQVSDVLAGKLLRRQITDGDAVELDVAPDGETLVVNKTSVPVSVGEEKAEPIDAKAQ
jgi:ATP-dependent Clp protease ATP-binding subunit ClpB